MKKKCFVLILVFHTPDGTIVLVVWITRGPSPRGGGPPNETIVLSEHHRVQEIL